MDGVEHVIDYDDDDRPTPGVVTGAVSIGTAPLPFLAVYTALFLLHGTIHPVHPPDIGSGQHDEVIAGIITLAAFVLLSAALMQFLNRRRRWPYAILELAVLVGGVDVAVDNTRGGSAIGLLLAATSAVSLALAFAPASWEHLGRPCPPAVAAVYTPVGLGSRSIDPPEPTPLPLSTEPTRTRSSLLRRSRTTD